MPITNSVFAPDVAFVLNSRLETIDVSQSFPVIAPDFVMELRSDTDKLQDIIAKMLEYIAKQIFDEN